MGHRKHDDVHRRHSLKGSSWQEMKTRRDRRRVNAAYKAGMENDAWSFALERPRKPKRRR